MPKKGETGLWEILLYVFGLMIAMGLLAALAVFLLRR
jgi:hypothetical protein